MPRLSWTHALPLLVGLLVLAASSPAVPVRAKRAATIEIEDDLASWDHLQITYGVTLLDASDDTARDTVDRAADAWNTALAHAPSEAIQPIALVPVGSSEKPDVDVLVSARRRSDWDGSTALTVDHDGRIQHAIVKVADPGFGEAFIVRASVTIVAHELGHVLGLGHATDPSDLMYPSAEGMDGPSDCDIRALEHVDRWLVDGGNSFVRPRRERIRC